MAAETMNPDWPLPLFDLARIASDRGDVERGLTLLRRAGAEPDYPLVELLEMYRAEPRRDVGRNDLCWCGSGRKYKKCHLGREQLPLDDRARWLYAKAIQHALVSGWNDLLIEVADERSRHAGDDPDALNTALGDPLVIDAVLFEGGPSRSSLRSAGRCCPTTSDCWHSSGCRCHGRCSRWSGCSAATASPCATCAPATPTRCGSTRPAASSRRGSWCARGRCPPVTPCDFSAAWNRSRCTNATG
ncbi:SEC-C motif family protein [Mycobacterium kansasii]|uniref:SEC-C motif family protein n=1 Tax=Mycobacterium kansasii TaxID=1768 RepID=A0A1V3WGS6_MYCKA|nr:SEC-C motif family protein [Mycobacterium kansasii]